VINEISGDRSLALGMTMSACKSVVGFWSLDFGISAPASGAVAHPMLVNPANQPFTTMKFPKKILLIDHEPGVTRLIRRALERAGKYLIREEHDDKLALNAARWFQPDLILVDTADQDRRNIERQIHNDAALKDTPVLSLSNLRPESQMVSGGILSGYSFFAAPIRVEEVLHGVDELLFGKD
jgi:PleD family two-component response regulator